MNKSLEIAANVFNAASILLATKNSFHTWWVGMAGGILFGLVFFNTQLYPDVALQIFFIATTLSVGGTGFTEAPAARFSHLILLPQWRRRYPKAG